MATRSSAGALVKARRAQLGLSQRTAAGVCGVPQPMLSRIESGDTQPSVGTLERLLAGLGADLVLDVRPTSSSQPRREKQLALWLSRLVVGELSRDPDRVLAIARANIARWRVVHAERPMVLASLDRWSQLLDAGVDAVAEVLTSQSEASADLRQNSPFAGVIDAAERQRAVAAFAVYWNQHHGVRTA